MSATETVQTGASMPPEDSIDVVVHPSQRAILVVWVMLILATCASWVIGINEEGTPGDVHPMNTLLLVIALAKVRFVGIYFMELATAPRVLRGIFEAWAVLAAALLCLLYVLL
ncbi:hypothetical protein GCM10009547_35560 [Sporichthya brevicatena]|uniref:Cytochrome c oxidase subunit IV n=1 Tax=Sporichthya brevicatena TaxID=171442 RepID=A0ABN1H4H5_9ACTN